MAIIQAPILSPKGVLVLVVVVVVFQRSWSRLWLLYLLDFCRSPVGYVIVPASSGRQEEGQYERRWWQNFAEAGEVRGAGDVSVLHAKVKLRRIERGEV